MQLTRAENARLTVDVVLLAMHEGVTHVLLIRRKHPPFENRLALPGGHVDFGEEVEEAAHRELLEETGLAVPELPLVGVYSTPGRDPRGRYVTWAFMVILDSLIPLTAGDDARDANWFPLSTAFSTPGHLAFDHARIVTDAIRQKRGEEHPCWEKTCRYADDPPHEMNPSPNDFWRDVTGL